jgi:hypothetical protein
MSIVQEMRSRPPAKPPGNIGIVGWIAAVAVMAALAAVGWRYADKLPRWPAAKPAAPVLEFPGVRLGDAAGAPAFQLCLARHGVTKGAEMGTRKILEALRTGTLGWRLAGVVRDAQPRGVNGISAGWAVIADCLYSQNTGTLCNIDNRALAVEATNGLMRLSEKSAETYSGANRNENQLIAIRERVLGSLRHRLRAGELIAADFGRYPAPGLKPMLDSEKPERDYCAR